MNKNFGIIVGLLLVVGILLSGCGETPKGMKPKPRAYSKLNEITIVADTSLWNSAVGDTFSYYFESPYLILPQPEPMFDLRFFSPRQIAEESLYRSYRTYIFLTTLDNPNSLTYQMVRKDIGDDKVQQARNDGIGGSTFGRNKWASHQSIFYLYAADQNSLIDLIKKSYPAIRDKIHSIDEPRLQATVFQGGRSGDISARVTEVFGAEMSIPKDYKVALDDGTTMWLRKETKELSGNILITKRKYTDPDQVSKKGLKELRDELGKMYVSSSAEGSFMVTNDEDLPLFSENFVESNNFITELHGIWELENDFMGGPFVSRGLVNQEKGELLFVDGFIFAPGEKKRNAMQYMETILKSVKF